MALCGSRLPEVVLSRAFSPVFMDLAIAQIAAMGAIISFQLFGNVGVEHNHGHLLMDNNIDSPALLKVMMPFVFSLGAAGLIACLSRFMEKELESIIGCLYVLAASSITLLLASNPNGAEHILKTLGGRILWLVWGDLVWLGVASAICLLVIVLRASIISGIFFYPLFAVIVTLGVQLVDVYLVFSMLIMPAIAVSRLSERQALVSGYLIGTLAVVSGLLSAHYYDLPGGASIIVTMSVAGVLFRSLTSLCKVAFPRREKRSI